MVNVVAALLLAVLPALAAPAGPHQVCRITDSRLDELSGLAATPTGYVAVNDGSDTASHRKIFYLNKRCKVTRTVPYPSRPRDTEDLALGPDGTLWVADIGDNDQERETIGLWRLDPGSAEPKLARLTYPDGPHDAEALLLAPGGTPIIVTKSVGAASLYVPSGSDGGLRRAGSVVLPFTDTSNPFGLPGRLVVTGGAVSADGTRALLRTYADAFEFDVAGGDVVRAVTTGKPSRVALPDEPQGESVAFAADGTGLLTVSEGSPAVVKRYPLPNPVASPSPSAGSPSAGSPSAGSSSGSPSAGPPSTASPSLRAPLAKPASAGRGTLPWLLAGGGLALLVAAAGIAVTLRRRR